MTNEKQKPVNDKYRNNWDEIFNNDDEPEKESPFEINFSQIALSHKSIFD